MTAAAPLEPPAYHVHRVKLLARQSFTRSTYAKVHLGTNAVDDLAPTVHRVDEADEALRLRVDAVEVVVIDVQDRVRIR